jgi:chromodomain-helicase-DNA-binding protein 1
LLVFDCAEEDQDDIPERNIEFLIKWKSHSHLHDTWELFSNLTEFKGFRKVENYIKSNIYEVARFRRHPDTTKEEIEQHDINIERNRAELEEWKTVERVIGMRDGVTVDDRGFLTTEYLCKWKGLRYDNCTWEAADLIVNDFQAEIDAFLDRDASLKVPSKSAVIGKHRPAFKRMQEQPEYIKGGELRDYQLLGVNWMAHLWSRDENGILADEMGLGKTVQTISFLNYLFHEQRIYGPFLIVVPLSTSENWMLEFKQWAPEMNVVCYIGNRQSREMIRAHEFYQQGGAKLKFNVLVTTYELVLKDRAELGGIKWHYLAVDEAHRLKNSQSQLHEALQGFNTSNRLLITGTPLQNNIKELSSLVNFLMPSLDISEWDVNIDEKDDQESQKEKIGQLHTQLKPYMLRRLKKDVERSLPNKTERILRVELSAMQMHYYKSILTKNFAALSNGNEKQKKQWLNIAMELKKASNHPFLFPDAEPKTDNKVELLKGLVTNSGKMVLLDKLLTRLKSDGHRVLIFSQMVMMLDILSDYMSLRGHPYQRLDGSMRPELRNKAIEHYNAPDSPDFVFLLSTRAGGMGINLVTADTVIIFDSDWNPQNDLQAMSRAHRIGQTKSVNVYRFVSKGTMEEDMIERAKKKMVLEYLLIKQMDTSGLSLMDKNTLPSASKSTGKIGELPFNKEEMSAILKFGAQKMFQDEQNTQKLDDMDLDDILARAEHTETLTNQGGQSLGGEEFLSQFQVADYGGTDDISWDDIIPENERPVAPEEEAANLEFYDRAAKRKQYNYGEASDDNESVHEDDAANGTKKRKVARSSTKKKSTGASNLLTERDLRAVIRGSTKFGDARDRYDEFVSDSDLVNKESSLVLEASDDLYQSCLGAVREYMKQSRPGENGIDAQDVPKPVLTTKHKAILITWRDINSVNAGQVVQRVDDLKVLHNMLKDNTQLSKFRITMSLKPVTSWACQWGHREDSMLLAGIYKHGFGSWVKIQQDEAFGLGDKFFLMNDDEDGPDDKKTIKKKGKTETKAPKAIHLVRRGDYLLKAIVADHEMKQAAASRRRSKVGSAKPSSSPISSVSKPKKTASTSSHKPSPNPSSSLAIKTKSPKLEVQDASEGTESGYESMDEEKVAIVLKPVKPKLVRLRDHAMKLNGLERSALIKDCIGAVGDHISHVANKQPSSGAREKLSNHMWWFAKRYWPFNKIKHQQLKTIYDKLQVTSSTGSPSVASPRSDHKSSSRHQSNRTSSSLSHRERDHKRRYRSDDNSSDDGGRRRDKSSSYFKRTKNDRSSSRERERERERERGRERGRTQQRSTSSSTSPSRHRQRSSSRRRRYRSRSRDRSGSRSRDRRRHDHHHTKDRDSRRHRSGSRNRDDCGNRHRR